VSSVRELITIDNQKDENILVYLHQISSTRFERCFRPSSGAYHCDYSFWYCPLMLLLAGVAYAKPASSSIRTEQQFRPDPARKLSANLCNIYHCRVYGEKLLMMDRGTVRNM
jgi:hypothetical protein